MSVVLKQNVILNIQQSWKKYAEIQLKRLWSEIWDCLGVVLTFLRVWLIDSPLPGSPSRQLCWSRTEPRDVSRRRSVEPAQDMQAMSWTSTAASVNSQNTSCSLQVVTSWQRWGSYSHLDVYPGYIIENLTHVAFPLTHGTGFSITNKVTFT